MSTSNVANTPYWHNPDYIRRQHNVRMMALEQIEGGREAREEKPTYQAVQTTQAVRLGIILDTLFVQQAATMLPKRWGIGYPQLGLSIVDTISSLASKRNTPAETR